MAKRTVDLREVKEYIGNKISEIVRGKNTDYKYMVGYEIQIFKFKVSKRNKYKTAKKIKFVLYEPMNDEDTFKEIKKAIKKVK